METIYTSTLDSDRGLRDLLVPGLIKHRILLSKNKVFLDLVKSGFADGDFTADVIAALSQLPEEPELVYFCGKCTEPTSPVIICADADCGRHMGSVQRF